MAVKGERSESAGHEVPLTDSTETTPSHVGEAEPPGHQETETNMERLLLSPEEAAEVLGVGRSRVYDLMRRRELLSVRIGKSRRVPVAAVRAYVEHLTEQEALV